MYNNIMYDRCKFHGWIERHYFRHYFSKLKINTKEEISFSRRGNQINAVDNEIKGRNFI